MIKLKTHLLDPSTSPPDFVYRIVTSAEWQKAQIAGVLTYADIDERDGYFHLSTYEQTLETARRYFTGRKGLLALEILYADLESACRWERVTERNDAYFPHYYGVVSSDFVKRAVPLENDDAGAFIFGADFL